jgi:hypothetical protein
MERAGFNGMESSLVDTGTVVFLLNGERGLIGFDSRGLHKTEHRAPAVTANRALRTSSRGHCRGATAGLYRMVVAASAMAANIAFDLRTVPLPLRGRPIGSTNV